MGDDILKAEDFERKASKKLESWGIFGSKHEDAAELFDKAANAFKLAKSCTFYYYSISICSIAESGFILRESDLYV